jgi:hypothetical protein
VVAAFLAGIAFHVVTAGHSAPSGTENAGSAASEGAVPKNSGPERVEHGVPAGFSDDRDGAVAAATSFVCSGQALIDTDPLSVEESIRQMATSASADGQVRDTLSRLADLRDRLSAGDGPIVLRQAAVAWKVDAIAATTARVEVWNVSVLSRDGVAPPQASWAISTLDLVWERGDWHLDHETVVPGPAPVLDNSAAPATAQQLIAAIDGFTTFGGQP